MLTTHRQKLDYKGENNRAVTRTYGSRAALMRLAMEASVSICFQQVGAVENFGWPPLLPRRQDVAVMVDARGGARDRKGQGGCGEPRRG